MRYGVAARHVFDQDAKNGELGLMNTNKVRKIFQRFQEKNPNPRLELRYKTSFELLVAVILSAQATDVSVNKATEKLFPVANTPEKLLKLGDKKFKSYIKSIGLYNSKAKNIMNLCKELVEKYHGQIPETREALEALPGVGRKSASVILNEVFGEESIAVDTHVFRVANRIGLAHSNNVLEIEKQLMKIVPKSFRKKVHYWLVLHGRYICKAKKPDCPHCFIKDLCEFPDKTV